DRGGPARRGRRARRPRPHGRGPRLPQPQASAPAHARDVGFAVCRTSPRGRRRRRPPEPCPRSPSCSRGTCPARTSCRSRAARTERRRVGIGILPVAARYVGFAAMDVGSLAELFPGLLDVGLGHGLPGWMRQVGAWPAIPLTLLREHTTALRALLAGETVTVAGRYVNLR